MNRKPDIDLAHMGSCPNCYELLCLRCIQLESRLGMLDEAQDWTELDRRAARRYIRVLREHRAERNHDVWLPPERHENEITIAFHFDDGRPKPTVPASVLREAAQAWLQEHREVAV